MERPVGRNTVAETRRLSLQYGQNNYIKNITKFFVEIKEAKTSAIKFQTISN